MGNVHTPTSSTTTTTITTRSGDGATSITSLSLSSSSATTTITTGSGGHRLSKHIVSKIFPFVSYGRAVEGGRCPAAVLPQVCQQWNASYRISVLTQLPIRRIMDWSVEMSALTKFANTGGQGTTSSLVDKASRDKMPRNKETPQWWTSSAGRYMNSGASPYRAICKDHKITTTKGSCPELIVTFSSPVHVRAIAIIARNLPRSVRVVASSPHVDLPLHECTLDFRSLVSWASIATDEYMMAVQEHLPEGQPPSDAALEAYPHLPVAVPLSTPLLCQELRLHLLSSHEPSWVGINVMGFFGNNL